MSQQNRTVLFFHPQANQTFCNYHTNLFPANVETAKRLRKDDETTRTQFTYLLSNNGKAIFFAFYFCRVEKRMLGAKENVSRCISPYACLLKNRIIVLQV